jgi:hypothetical protein
MLPENSETRKTLPVADGVLHYFPDAIAYVALVSKVGNDKHNPGEPLHWSRGKSDDHLNCIGRHMLEHGQYASDGILHDGNLAWRALANLQLTLERLTKLGHNVFALHGGQKSKDMATPIWYSRALTETVTINEHAHGADHHAATEQQSENATGNGGM